MSFTGRDIEWTDDGDLVADGQGDLKLADSARTIMQDVQWRIQNEFGDHAADPDMAAGLSRYQGKPNVQATWDQIKEACYYALTRDGRFARGDIAVDVVPYSLAMRAVLIFVFFQGYIENLDPTPNPYDQSGHVISFRFGLDDGLIERITGVKE